MESRNSAPPGGLSEQAFARTTDWFRKARTGFLDSLLASSSLMLFAVDLQDRFMAVSAGWERSLDYAAAELLERRVGEFLSDQSDWDAFLGSLRDGEEATETLDFIAREGQAVRFEVTGLPWFDETEKLLGYAAYARDISVWEKFQDDLVRIDRLAEMGRMSAGIVHDLKNPLSIINQAAGWAGVVVEDAKGLGEEDRNELSHTLKEIEEQTGRCRRITNQILDYVRETQPEKVGFDLKELLQETLRYLQPELSYPPVEVIFDFDESSPLKVETDYKLLQQVLVNLLSNAIYAVRENEDRKGSIKLDIAFEEDCFLVSVIDNGPGIAPEVQEKIFDLFYTTKPAGKGTGLGLPICRSIMRRLGGELSFESQIGLGTTFTMSIPAKAVAS